MTGFLTLLGVWADLLGDGGVGTSFPFLVLEIGAVVSLPRTLVYPTGYAILSNCLFRFLGYYLSCGALSLWDLSPPGVLSETSRACLLSRASPGSFSSTATLVTHPPFPAVRLLPIITLWCRASRLVGATRIFSVSY